MAATLQHLRDKYIQLVRDSSCEYLEDFEFGSQEEMVDWVNNGTRQDLLDCISILEEE